MLMTEEARTRAAAGSRRLAMFTGMNHLWIIV
jgi:hypothetical protein